MQGWSVLKEVLFIEQDTNIPQVLEKIELSWCKLSSIRH